MRSPLLLAAAAACATIATGDFALGQGRTSRNCSAATGCPSSEVSPQRNPVPSPYGKSPETNSPQQSATRPPDSIANIGPTAPTRPIPQGTPRIPSDCALTGIGSGDTVSIDCPGERHDERRLAGWSRGSGGCKILVNGGRVCGYYWYPAPKASAPQPAPPATAPSFAQAPPYSTIGFDPVIQLAVERARVNASMAHAAATRARAAALEADDAARRARNGEAGYAERVFNVGVGQIRFSGYPATGSFQLGVQTELSGIGVGNTFRGTYSANNAPTLGVSEFPASTHVRRYEGEMRSGLREGFGVAFYGESTELAGSWRNSSPDGFGVMLRPEAGIGLYRVPDPRRSEGEFRPADRTFLGVHWSASGMKYSSGVWSGDRLVTPMGPQYPDPNYPR